MLKNLTIVAEPSDAGQRLDRVILAHCTTSSRRLILNAIGGGKVSLNGRQAGKGVKLNPGDKLEIQELAEAVDIRIQPQPELPLSVVYEDDDLMALDKPAGQSVHPLNHWETGTMLNALVGRYPDMQDIGDDPLLPAVIHRIDADTSGLVVAARTERAYGSLRDQFRTQTVRKAYMAVVRGTVIRPRRIESLLVHRTSGDRHRMAVLEDGRPPRGQKPMRAVTEYEPVECRNGKTLLWITIFTGVTHQIRCQLAHEGFGILGDQIYGSGWEDIDRQYLHAVEITLSHPADGHEMTIQSALPEEFGAVMDSP